MVAGAVNRSDDLALHQAFSSLSALSPSGRSRPFHREADGLVPAEGCAVVTLMRLSDALAAGRRVLGVIRGIGLSNSGRSSGLLAPTAAGQIRALERAYAAAASRHSRYRCFNATPRAPSSATSPRSAAPLSCSPACRTFRQARRSRTSVTSPPQPAAPPCSRCSARWTPASGRQPCPHRTPSTRFAGHHCGWFTSRSHGTACAGPVSARSASEGTTPTWCSTHGPATRAWRRLCQPRQPRQPRQSPGGTRTRWRSLPSAREPGAAPISRNSGKRCLKAATRQVRLPATTCPSAGCGPRRPTWRRARPAGGGAGSGQGGCRRAHASQGTDHGPGRDGLRRGGRPPSQPRPGERLAGRRTERLRP